MPRSSLNVYADDRLDELDGVATNPATGKKMVGPPGVRRKRRKKGEVDIDGREVNPYGSKPKTGR